MAASSSLGDRISMTVGSETITYTLDVAAPLVQVIVATTDGAQRAYLYGVARIGEDDGGWQYYLADHLGSVRSLVDTEGSVAGTRAYQPYGAPLSSAGVAESVYGFTGEQTDPTGFVYLRARMYAPGLGVFLSRDPWEGNPNRPTSYNAWLYGYANPIQWIDRTGLSPKVACENIPWYLDLFFGLRKNCEIGNGDDNDSTVLEARERFFRGILRAGDAARLLDPGYRWASVMLERFLDGNGALVNIRFSELDAFPQDQGVTRATKENRPALTEDEPETIRPLLSVFVYDYVQPAAKATTLFQVGPIGLEGEDFYSPPGSEPRPYSKGFWAAFGHVVIDGVFSANGRLRQTCDGYFLEYEANYRIDDRYEWFENMQTPFDFPGGSGTVWIPHQWEISLEQANPPRAMSYDYSISWTEKRYAFLSRDFEQLVDLDWWAWQSQYSYP
jgi:RHS repeat-associated protein